MQDHILVTNFLRARKSATLGAIGGDGLLALRCVSNLQSVLQCVLILEAEEQDEGMAEHLLTNHFLSHTFLPMCLGVCFLSLRCKLRFVI
jgi:hypothetical protein